MKNAQFLPEFQVMGRDEICAHFKEQIQELFNRLDLNKDGKIDIKDLSDALHQLGVPQIPGQAQRLLERSDHDQDGHLNFADFLKYVTEHEKHLRLSFHMLDHNKDGVIDVDEIMFAFRELGVQIDRPEAERLLRRMDKDETLKINYDEFREYLLLHPSSNIWDLVHYWRHASIIDVGEDVLVPDDFTERELQSGIWWRHLLAGAVSGGVSRTCTAPFDRLKVLLQVHGSKHSNLGIINGFVFMRKEGGVKSFWRGNGINVLKIAPESALKFMAYEQIKRLFKHGTDRELYTIERFISGSMAGAISQSAIYPMEVIKTRLALRKTGQFKGISDCALNIYNKEGLRSFYRGYVPNLFGIMPYAGIDLAVYETLKRWYIQNHPRGEDYGILAVLACSTVSSTCGQLASYPLALVRTKLQAKVTLDKNDTMRGLIRHIYRTEGLKGFYRGITPNFMKAIPAVGISYVVYEKFRTFLGVEMT